MTSQTSSLNIAIKSGKHQVNLVTMENRTTYWERIISNIPNRNGYKTSKTITYTLEHSK